MKIDFFRKNKNLNELEYDISSNHISIFENMVLGVSIFELVRDKEQIVDLKVNYINPRSLFNKIKPNEKFLGKTINKLLDAEKVDFYLNMAREVVSSGKGLRYEIYFEQLNKNFLINAFSTDINLFVVLDVDITQRKETEEELKKTLEHLEIEKRQLSAIVENIPVGVIIAEAPSGKFILANKQIAEIWRYPKTASADEFMKYKGFHPDGKLYKSYEWPLSRSIRNGKVIKDEEIQIVRGDGTKGWISVSSVPVHDDGNILLGIVIDLDITERKKAEEKLKKARDNLEKQVKERTAELKEAYNALKENEEKFREIFNNANDMITVSKLQENGMPGKFIEVNEVALKLLGYTREEFLNMTPSDIILPDSPTSIEEVTSDMLQNGFSRHESIFLAKNGSKIYFEVATHFFSLKEKNLILAVSRDITERKKVEESLKESEKKFRELFNKAVDVILLSEVKENKMPGKFIEVNDAAIKKLGYSKEEFLNMTPIDLFAPEDMSIIPQINSELQKSRYTTFEAISITKQGMKFPVEVNVHLFKLKGKDVGISMARDITERKKAENALKESEEKFRALYDDNPSIYFTINSEFKVLSVNRFGAEQLGYKIYELVNEPLSIIFYEKDREFALKKLKNTLKNHDKTFHWELRKLRKDGSILWVKETARAVKERDENIVIYTVCEDITDRKRAEEDLKRSETILEEASGLSKMGAYEWDIEKDVFILSKEWQRIHGVKEDRLFSINLMETAFPEDAPKVQKALNEALEDNKPYDLEHRIVNQSNGEIRYIHSRGRVLRDKNGNPIKMYGVAEDITERKMAEKALVESEEKLDATIESSPDSITVADLDLKITSCNHATVVMYRGSSKDEIIGLRILDLVVSKYHALILEAIEKLLKDMKSVTLEVELYRKDKTVFPVEISTNVVKDVNGKPTSFVGITKDISDRKNAEKERENLIKELKRSNEELQQFAYVASHDLQEPLRTIASFTQLIERRYKGKLDKDADEFMDFIVDGATRMQDMIKDLLQYSRVETRGEEFKPASVQNALDNTLSNLKVTIEENNAEITHDDLPTVIGDEKQLIQLFQNLISNAIKFRKKDVPPKIHISSFRDEEKNEYIFSVSDNGIGMEPDQTKHIFEIFQRLHTRDEYKGTGIGLAVAKKIVERHGGRIWVESEPGKGTIFYFTMPVDHAKS